MGTVHWLRPIRVLLASRDPRFLGVTSFLLARTGFAAETTRRLGRLLEQIDLRAANVVVLDGSESMAAAARTAALIRASNPRVGVILVAEHAEQPVVEGFDLLPKWSPFADFVARVERAYMGTGYRKPADRHTVGAGGPPPERSYVHFHGRLLPELRHRAPKSPARTH